MAGPHVDSGTPPRRTGWRSPADWPRLLILLVVSTGAIGASVAWGVSLVDGRPVPTVAGGVTSGLALLIPTAVCWWAVAGRGRGLGVARLAAGAVTAFAAGMVWNGASVVLNENLPIPSPADVGFLVFYVLVLAVLGLLVHRHLAELRIRAGLDLTASILTVLALMSVPLDPLVGRALAGQMSVGLALTLLYPALDLLLVTVVVGVVMFGGARAVPGWGWLTAGLIGFMVADLGFALGAIDADSVTTSALQLGWFIGLALIAVWAVGLAAASRCGRQTSVARTRAEYSETVVTSTAASATFAGLAVLVLGTHIQLSVETRVLAGLAIVFYGARAQLAFREVRRGAALLRMAHTDHLTDLPNRRALYARAEERLAPGAADGALLLMDLDRFKEVNDSLGHHMGDRLLIDVSRRLSSCLPEGALLVRLGGDEFAVLLNASGAGPALALAERVRATTAEPFDLDGMSVEVAMSIGIALFPEHGEDLESVLRHADIAMYRAKRSASHVHVYAPEVDAAGTKRLGRVAEVRAAFDRGEFIAYYQPKLDLGTRRVAGVEALVRWQHPAQGLLMPGVFLDLVEDVGLMHRLTQSMLSQALDQVVEWHRIGVDLTVAVNLSASSLIDVDMPGRVRAMLAERSLAPQVLELEITEDLLMADRRQARAILADLRSGGVRIAIDDFGSGYSSLAYLRDLPIDELKIDRAFIEPLAGDPRAEALVSATVALAHGLDQVVVAEGVEDEATLDRLAELGCDQAQGYFIARPMPGGHIPEWLATHDFTAGVAAHRLGRRG
ncbi:MAG: EAL domain-containing protein [Cellulomonas sp.]|nr:EAL domain-containing protein [Cellulomonas sp.]